MRLLKRLEQSEQAEFAGEEVISGHDVEHLKRIGWKLCAESGVHDAVWISSTANWQELSSVNSAGQVTIHFVIRP